MSIERGFSGLTPPGARKMILFDTLTDIVHRRIEFSFFQEAQLG